LGFKDQKLNYELFDQRNVVIWYGTFCTRQIHSKKS
jgi:hypothetical protein